MRHAEVVHKAGSTAGQDIRDPTLTPEGGQQGQVFAASFGDQVKHITYILYSPMERTVLTAYEGLNSRELGLSELKNRYLGQEKAIDMVTLGKKSWNEKVKGIWRSGALQWHIDYIKGLLQGLQAANKGAVFGVVIVSHRSFLNKLAGPGKSPFTLSMTQSSNLVDLLCNIARVKIAQPTNYVFNEKNELREIDQTRVNYIREAFQKLFEQIEEPVHQNG
ncbi:uncharacterized protein PAC_03295 [Phialocephala subalpina]|uniref:Phosphoglycerate mutase family protein n=1 Tax=Phialocephala subalpina TaxID=576137 RepID=A0A1L7WKX6_9HELO|nr:uncharacterized protein PAC_03295 [Phialocephala subalpina]